MACTVCGVTIHRVELEAAGAAEESSNDPGRETVPSGVRRAHAKARSYLHAFRTCYLAFGVLLGVLSLWAALVGAHREVAAAMLAIYVFCVVGALRMWRDPVRWVTVLAVFSAANTALAWISSPRPSFSHVFGTILAMAYLTGIGVARRFVAIERRYPELSAPALRARRATQRSAHRVRARSAVTSDAPSAPLL